MTEPEILVPDPPIRVIHVEATRDRSWWPVWMTGVTAALIGAVALTFTLITTVQRADRAEHRFVVDAERDTCAALFAADITSTQQTSDNALNELVALISRQIFSTTPPDQERFTRAIDRLEETDATADASVSRRDAWLAEGSPLPCPLQVGG